MKLSDYLHQRKISASEAARQIGCPIPTVTRLLRGDRGVSLRTATKIEQWSDGAVRSQDLLLETRP